MFNLNQLIDVNYYPIPEAHHLNMCHHPIGIGVQGLTNTFMALGMPFDLPKAKVLNIQIFETIYHVVAEVSMDMAETEGLYESWEGSPMSQGKLQFDLWGDANGPVGLGQAEGVDSVCWHEELAFVCAHADGLDQSDLGLPT